MPTWLSIRLPAAPMAQNTMPKQNPIAMPRNISLSTITGHIGAPMASIGVPAIAIGSATIARLTRKLLRTMAGMVWAVSSGSMTNAPMIRGRVSARASSALPKPSNGIRGVPSPAPMAAGGRRRAFRRTPG